MRNSGRTSPDFSRRASAITRSTDANRLGANSLVSCVYGGFVAAPSAIEYAKNVDAARPKRTALHAELKRQVEINEQIISNRGRRESIQASRRDGQGHDRQCHRRPLQRSLKATDEKLLELQERFTKISINDSNLWATQACRMLVNSGT
jgi:succinate dehydrogenase / fumarate reductase flavoprotein subunit